MKILRDNIWRTLLPAALLGLAAVLVVALGAVAVDRQLRENERLRTIDEARQLAFGFSREAAERFWRFREEFIFSLTHLPYERLLHETEASPETLLPVRRFLALNQDILRELVVVSPERMGRSMRMRGENYIVSSPLAPRLPPGLAGEGDPAEVAISGVVQGPDGGIKAYASALLDPLRFWREAIASFSLSHSRLWVQLLDSEGRPLVGRHAGDYLEEAPVFSPEVVRRLAEDAAEGYEGRLFHRAILGGKERTLISSYVPVRVEEWRGVLMISQDEEAIFGPAAKAIGLLTGIALLVFVLLLSIFVLFLRHTIRHQRQLVESRRLAEESAREAEAANRAKSTFLAMMSHELRTPLNSILGLSESLVERLHGPLNDKQARYLDFVLTSGRHLLALINDILDLAKIESGRMEARFAPCSVRAVCEGALQMVQPVAVRRRQRLSNDLPPAELMIEADPKLLHHLLSNLLSNAVKFTPEGGELGLRVLARPDELRIQVWDRGIGIARADMRRLFQPFVQLDSRLSRDYGGTGLGLALVKQMAELHGGRMEVESDPGMGSTFTFVLPLPVRPSSAVAVAPAAGSASGREAEPSPGSDQAELAGLGPLVLIVDDIPLNILPVRDYLEAKGCRVAVAENGRIALSRVPELRPDVILMDIQMPEMDGIEATRRIRALPDPELARTPIIAVTALAMPADRDRCLAAGANDYVAKPYGLRDLHRRVLELHASRSAAFAK